MDLERGVRPLEGHVVARHVERVVAVDPDAEGFVPQAADGRRERAVAARVGEHARLEVIQAERRQDADGDGPPAVRRGRPVDGGERVAPAPPRAS